MDDFYKKSQIEKKIYFFVFIDFIYFFSGYYRAKDSMKHSKCSGLRPDTSNLVFLLNFLKILGNFLVKFRIYNLIMDGPKLSIFEP